MNLLVRAFVIKQDGHRILGVMAMRAAHKKTGREDIMPTVRTNMVRHERGDTVLDSLPTQSEFPPRGSFGTHADLGRLDNQALFLIEEVLQLVGIQFLVATKKTS